MKLPSFLRFGRRDAVSGLENPSVDLIEALVAHVDGAATSGVTVTPLKAFRLAAVYACVRAIAEPVASLPLLIAQADGSPPGNDQGREVVGDDDRWNLLNGFPNPEMTGMQLMENWIAHALLWGRGYLYIVRNKAGRPVELWPLPPDKTEPMRTKDENRLYYVTELADGKKQPLPADVVIPLDSILGISPVMHARDVIASAAAAEQYAGRFWANNGRPGGVIELPESMDEDEMDEFMRRWRAGHEGLKRAQLVGILSGGAKWKDVGIAPGQAQFIETREFSTREIARLFRVPPHMIGDLEGTVTRASIEQQAIEFVTYTLRPWIVRVEQALRMKLFNTTADLKADRYPQFNVDELMRGDMKARYEALAIGIQWGFLSRADARRIERKPTMDPENQLEEFLVPLNMIPSSRLDEIDVAGATGKKGTQPTTGSDGSDPQTNALALLSLSNMLRDQPELAERLAVLALEQAKR